MRRVLTGLVVTLAAGLWLGAASCGKGGGASGPKERTPPLGREPLFPADLGPDTVDVRAYPASQQENYALFVEKCSGCHTLARAVNSPIVDAPTWNRYAKRMHGKNQARENGGVLLSGEEAKRVISFLVFDSRERKIKRADEFQNFLADLGARYEQETQAWKKTKGEEGQRLAQESAPYVGDR